MFFKKQLPDSSFNDMLILATADTVRKFGRLPTEPELSSTMEKLLKQKNQKLTSEQAYQVTSCAAEFGYRVWAQDLIPEFEKHLKEFPAELTSFNRIKETFKSYGMLLSDPDEFATGDPELDAMFRNSMRNISNLR